MTGTKINEAIPNRTAAKITGDKVERTMRAATKEKPHIIAVRIAATMPYEEDRRTRHHSYDTPIQVTLLLICFGIL